MAEQKRDGRIASVLQALGRILWGPPGTRSKTPIRRTGRGDPWATTATGDKKIGGEPLDSPPLHILRRGGQDMQRIYAEVIRLSAQRENSYKDYEDMIIDPTIGGALELMTDDACQFNRDRNATVWVNTDDVSIRKAANELWDIGQIEDRVWDWAFNGALYGDFMIQPDAQVGKGVVSIMDDWHPADVQRIDVNGQLLGWRTPRTQSDTMQTMGTIEDKDFHEAWEFVHFKISASQRRRREVERQRMMPSVRFEKDEYRLTTKYGVSVLEAVRRIYKQLQMVEQSLIIARMTRALKKYLYTVQVGSQSSVKAAAETTLAMRDLLTQQTGLRIGERFEQQFSPPSGSEDVFLPEFGDRGHVDVQELGGDVDVHAIVDVDYLRNKLFGGLKVPKAYLGFEECARGITKVKMLDGSEPMIKDIAENFDQYKGKYVYTCSPSGRITPSPIVYAKKTRRNATFVRVHIDNGEHVDFTPDHPMMLRDGTFRNAGELKTGDSLMPLYTRVAEEGPYNHKVVRVEKLDVVEDAYDIGVEHANHTFGLAAGIFVHNSLPGSLGESALLRLDIRYARTVKRIQRMVLQGLTRLLQIHLAYKKIDPDPSRFAVEMDVISTAEEEERKSTLASSIMVARDLVGLNTDLGIRMQPKKLAKLIYSDVLQLQGEFVELVDSSEELPTEGIVPGTEGGMGGALPGMGPGAEMPDMEGMPGEEEMPGEGPLEMPPPPEEQQPGEGPLPTPAGRRESAESKAKGTRALVDQQGTIAAEAKRQAINAVTRAIRHSPEVRDHKATTPQFEKNVMGRATKHYSRPLLEKLHESKDFATSLTSAMQIEYVEAEKEREADVAAWDRLRKLSGEIDHLVSHPEGVAQMDPAELIEKGS